VVRGAKKPGKEDENKPKGILNHTICQVLNCIGELNVDGFCEMGKGYPFYMRKQPAVCPTCRERLAWSGNCLKCWMTYCQEGPGYYFEDVDGHWQNTGEKQRMFTRQEISVHMRELSRIAGINL